MVLKKYSILAVLLVFSPLVFAQVAITKGDLKMEIGGVLSSYFNKRWIKPEASNQNLNKDRFKLRDARFLYKAK